MVHFSDRWEVGPKVGSVSVGPQNGNQFQGYRPLLCGRAVTLATCSYVSCSAQTIWVRSFVTMGLGLGLSLLQELLFSAVALSIS